MPLKPGKSKEAFKHNVEIEMDSGKPKDQSLAIAFNMKRKKKKMAKGGQVNESAASEHRPMPSERDQDAKMVARNSAKKPLVQSGMTSRPDIAQSQNKPKIQPIKHPRMVPSDAFSARLYDHEEHLERTASPGPIDAQPPREDDEIDADKSGPKVPDMAKQHSNDREPYADGGLIHEMDMQPEPEAEEEHHDSIAAAVMAKRRRMAEGGQVDLDLNAEEEPNQYYRQNEAALKENYDEDIHDVSQPLDSNEHADPREEDESDVHDMVESIRRKLMVRRQFTKD